MILAIFAILFVLESIFILKYAKRTLRKQPITDCIVTDKQLEEMRKKLNSRFSKC